MQLQPGIRLTVIPTEKYKTIRIFIRFSAKHSEKTATKRTLLTSLLETNSLHYPKQTDISSQLAELYGATFGLSVGKKGNVHQVNVLMSLVNGKYIGNPDVLSEGIDFLKEILFYPNIKDGHFDKETFTLEKDNLAAYLKSLQEDKQTLASLRLQELYFSESSDQKVPSFGSVEDLEKVTSEELVQTYQEMLAQDEIDIFVVGDIEEADVLAAFTDWTFPETDRLHPEIFYHQPAIIDVKEEVLREAVTQAKLNMAFQTSIYYGDQRRFALMLFNGLFGGFPHSKLFLNVREKESLAYYASSSVDTFRGFVSVQTGIDGSNRARVLQLVEEQLNSLRQGVFTEEEIAQTKAMLRNQYLLSLDNPQALIETAYLNQWLPETQLTESEFLANLMKVTKEEIQEVAQDIHLQAIFVLDGEE
ncbi:EF-P 5-aminopentanol modification-associated protein YfmF [Enterococcus olivae]